MKKFLSTIFLTAGLLITIASCTGRQPQGNIQGDTISMEYAQLLEIRQCDGFKLATIKDPWKKGATLHIYALVNRESDVPAGIPTEATVVRVPLQRMCVSTSVHSNLLMQIGATDHIGSVCDANYILNPTLQRLIRQGKIADMGSAMNPSIEKIVENNADALLMSPFEGASYGMLEKTGLPIIECADYMETSVLGRAEWMKFYGLLVGKESEACELFAEVKANYNSLKEMAARETTHPKLLVDMLNGPTWYVPGGSSTYGTLYKEAGATYTLGEEGVSGSQGLSIEKVMQLARDADIWLVRTGTETETTYASLAAENTLYQTFDAFKNRHIYGCNTLVVPFYDEVPFRPDYLMSDVIKILYPHLLPDHQLRYYTPLK